MSDIISIVGCIIVCWVFIWLFILKPLLALGDIPGEIRDLREAVEKLTKVIEERDKKE